MSRIQEISYLNIYRVNIMHALKLGRSLGGDVVDTPSKFQSNLKTL